MIRVARWRTGGAIASAAVGLCFLAGLYGWLWVFLGHEAAIDGFREDPLGSVLTVAPLLIVAFQLGACIRAALRGDRLTLDPAGFHYRLYRQVGFVRWQDVEQFRTEAPTPGLPEVVGWDYRSDRAGDPIGWKRLRTTGRYPTSLHGDLGHRWQGGSKAVRDALETWRQRHASVEVAAEPVLVSPVVGLDFPSEKIIRFDPLRSVAAAVFLGLALAGVVAFVSWLGAVSGGQGFVWLIGGVGAILLGPPFWINARRLLARPLIKLSARGFEIRDEDGVRFTAWGEVEAFILDHDAHHHEYVGWRLKSPAETRPAMQSWDHLVGMGFKVAPHVLRDTLEDWRVRFSQPSER